MLQRGDKREGMGEVARGGICVDRACALEFMNKNTDRWDGNVDIWCVSLCIALFLYFCGCISTSVYMLQLLSRLLPVETENK